MSLFQQVERSDAENERRTHHPARSDHVEDSRKERRGEDDIVKTRHERLGALTHVFDLKSLWGLHPGVGHDDPSGAERRANDDHRCGEQPHAIPKASATKKHEA
ncbi:unannotated protein [freshwater metagenome]|uniref:Unannotated protein n=1 Tax=freshwater metagenome TaxID=449393 RepID=A0A6J7M1A2_9ZZZZ